MRCSDDIYQFSHRSKELFFAVNGEVVSKENPHLIQNVKIYLANKNTGKEILSNLMKMEDSLSI